MQKQPIIIVGAGIAGLIAAKELIEKYDVLVLEASDRIGGRISTLRADGFSTHIEAGAEFIHGHLKETIHLLKEAGIDYEEVEGKMYRKENGKFKEENEMIEGWDDLLKKMESLEQDMTMHDFLQQYFSENKYADLRKQAIAYAEGFDVADVKQASVCSLYNEWSQEENTNYRIPTGYGSLIDFLTAECEREGVRIITNETVKQIDWETNDVTIYTNSTTDDERQTAVENKYSAEKIIITVPISVLQSVGAKAAINFTPALDEYINAARQIGFGNVIKVLLQFKEPFWQKDAGFIFSDEAIPTWWTQLPDDVALLTGWVGGSKAECLNDNTENEIAEKALQSLANIFDLTLNKLKDNLIASKIVNWQKDEYAMGAYSYATPQTTAAINVLNNPVNATIYFCGEALYEGTSPGTVEAAIVHAKQVAQKIIGSF
ncbi:MAG: NAD(P)/FAD-dependent oxidoreductase [Ferruginibacter sp.]